MSADTGVRSDAEKIINAAIASALPDRAVKKALSETALTDSVYIIAIGKAAYRMARAASDFLGGKVKGGMVITKYGHAGGSIGPLRIFEAGHPIPDENSAAAAREALALAKSLTKGDTAALLISGGGSALFESPLISLEELQDVNRQLLASGADITEINTIRKRLSAVKGGRFALECAPARVVSVVLSDIIGDPLDMIASGPAYPDKSTCADALAVVRKYGLKLTGEAMALLNRETPKSLGNAETRVTGSVRELCAAAAKKALELGYRPEVLTDCLSCAAGDAGSFMASIARTHAGSGESLAFIAGGETVVRLTGGGLGGRNQELALSAAQGLAGLKDVCLFSVGSDGTDGPTDAAGGIVDGDTRAKLDGLGVSIPETLKDNDSYHALKACGGLVITGPTGTNVNDVCALLIKR